MSYRMPNDYNRLFAPQKPRRTLGYWVLFVVIFLALWALLSMAMGLLLMVLLMVLGVSFGFWKCVAVMALASALIKFVRSL